MTWPHLHLDFQSESTKLNDRRFITDVLNKVVVVAGMRVLVPAMVYQTDTIIAGESVTGLTGFVVLHESHAAIHTVVEGGIVMFDLFSCKVFPYSGVTSYIYERLEVGERYFEYEDQLLWRGIPDEPT